MASGALTARQVAFVEHYCITNCAATAARAAGYAPKCADIQGYQQLQKPLVRQAIEERRRQAQAESGVTPERVLRELGRIAFFDPRKLFDKTGRALPITELDDDTAAAVAGLDVEDLFLGAGKDKVPVGNVLKYKIASKVSALSELREHFKLTPTSDEDNRELRIRIIRGEGRGRATVGIDADAG